MQHELSAEEARLTYLLFPHRRGLELDHVEDRDDLVQLVARTRTPPVTCPECGEPATRVHDRYWRRHQDLSWCGRPVQAVLQVRRFICDNPACVVATFAEQVATPRSTSMAGTGPPADHPPPDSGRYEPIDSGSCTGNAVEYSTSPLAAEQP